MAEYIDRRDVKKLIEYAIEDNYALERLEDINSADVIERSEIDKAKTNIEIMLEQEKQKDGTYTDVGKGIAIALGLLNNEIGE